MPVEDAVLVLRSAFGALPAGDPPPAFAPPEPSAGGSAEIELGAPQGYLAVGSLLDVPASERPALTIGVAVLSDRLAFDLRETKGLAYSVGASLRPWGDRLRFGIEMGTRPDNLEAAEAGLREALSGLTASPPGTEEIARVVQALRGRALMRRMTRISLAYEAGMEILRGKAPGEERRSIDALDRVAPEEVRDVLGRRLGAPRLARVVVR